MEEIVHYTDNKEYTYPASDELETGFDAVGDYFPPQPFEHLGLSLDGLHYLDFDRALQHTAVFASTGAGKSSVHVVPTIANNRWPGSYVINDPSTELYKILAPSLRRNGFQVWRLDWRNPYGDCIYWNPMDLVKTTEDTYLLADLLVRSKNKVSENGNELHWIEKATDMVTSLLILVRKLPKEQQNLGTVYRLLLETKINSKTTKQLFIDKNVPNDFLTTFLAATSDKTQELSGILSTAIRSLFPYGFQNENVNIITSSSNIDLNDLRNKRIALFIQSSDSRSQLYKSPIATLIEQIWVIAMEQEPAPDQYPIKFIIDESGSFLFPTLPEKIPLFRKYHIGLSLFYQAPDQLKAAFNASLQAIIKKTVRTHIYTGSQNEDTAEILERALGRQRTRYGDIIPLQRCEQIRAWSDRMTMVLRQGMRPLMNHANVPYFQNAAFSHLPRRKYEGGKSTHEWINGHGEKILVE